MKNVLIILSVLMIGVNAMSQNVGVNTNTPTQPLDVVGNINTTGNLMVSGVAGANGQVLGMNGTTMQWMDKSRFTNWAFYNTPGTSSFTVPAGITEVMIEMWGAGGGGHNPGGGGGSGGYFIGLVPVAGISSISVTVGDGGSGGSNTTPPAAGTGSRFIFSGFNILANGGQPGDSVVAGSIITYIGGSGGSHALATIPTGYKNYFLYHGNAGMPTQQSLIQTASTTFNTLFIGGVGGMAPNSGQISPQPNSQYNNGSSNIRTFNQISNDSYFGSGGSVTFSSNSGNPGGDGRIIIYY